MAECWLKKHLTDPAVDNKWLAIAVFSFDLPGLGSPFVVAEWCLHGPALFTTSFNVGFRLLTNDFHDMGDFDFNLWWNW